MPTSNLEQHGLHQKLMENNTAILADTVHFQSFPQDLGFLAGSVISPATAFNLLSSDNTFNSDHYKHIASNIVFYAEWPEKPVEQHKALFTARLVDQLFVELAKDLGHRTNAGPHVIQIIYEEDDDMSSIVRIAQRVHKTFTANGVPRESVIVSIPATEVGILAARMLQDEGMIICLHLVCSLVHAQACVEAGVSAISISVGPLLELYERRRNTVYQDLTDHPGIQTIQSILVYFRENGIKTKVFGTDFRNLAEIGLLSECDAVCVSAEHLDKLRWSQVPTASFDLDEEPQVVLRARQAKYPTDLLTRDGGFLSWFSTESRSMISELHRDVLYATRFQMDYVEVVAEEEVTRRMDLLLPLEEFIRRNQRNNGAGHPQICNEWGYNIRSILPDVQYYFASDLPLDHPVDESDEVL